MPLVAVVDGLAHQRVLLAGNLLLAQRLCVVKHEAHTGSLLIQQTGNISLLGISQLVHSIQRDQCINPLGQCLVQRLGRVTHTETASDSIGVTGQVLTRDPGHHELSQLA